MKRILLACLLLTATFTFSSVQRAAAQAVTATSFTTQVNQLDEYIAAGNTAMANTTFDSLNTMMQSVLAVSKSSIVTAATPADHTNYMNINHNQTAIYETVFDLKSDMIANRAAINSKLMAFEATIY